MSFSMSISTLRQSLSILSTDYTCTMLLLAMAIQIYAINKLDNEHGYLSINIQTT